MGPDGDDELSSAAPGSMAIVASNKQYAAEIESCGAQALVRTGPVAFGPSRALLAEPAQGQPRVADLRLQRLFIFRMVGRDSWADLAI